jgi:phosphatidylglycerophosphate synthase
LPHSQEVRPKKAADYHVLDNSLLVPLLKRFVWAPTLSRIPHQTSANTMTLCGTALSAIAFAITVFVPATRLSCAAVAALIFTYLTLDNIDGAQARRTGTSSPLGEFLDHWLDSINMAFLFMGCILTWEIPAERSVLVMIFGVSSYTMTFWEQKVTGRIHMLKVGNVEGIVVVVAYYVLGVIFGPRAVIDTQLFAGQTAIDIYWISAIVTTALTTVGPIVRVRSSWGEIVEIITPLAAICVWYQFGGIPWTGACALS